MITGGGTGIGAAIAERFAAESAHVVVVGRRLEQLQAVEASVGADAGKIVCGRGGCGIRSRRGGRRCSIIFGRIDVLVANAGGHGFASVGETDDDGWQASGLTSNLTTAFTMARESLPALIEARKGQIVVISSLAGLFREPTWRAIRSESTP